MYSLFIDTHDKNVLIIIYKDGKVLLKKEVTTKNKHSEVTMPTLADALNEINIKIKDINDVYVVNGPGSFTGERIAVTIAKTIAFCLNIPIRVIDSLTIMALQIDGSDKYIALEDRNGAFVGHFNQKNEIIENFDYLSKSVYEEYKASHNVVTECEVDYDKVYKYASLLPVLHAHEVKPLYVKGISALNGK